MISLKFSLNCRKLSIECDTGTTTSVLSVSFKLAFNKAFEIESNENNFYITKNVNYKSAI